MMMTGAEKTWKWKTPRCWFSWVLKSSTKRWEWNFLFANYFKYFLQLKHKNKLMCELCQIFLTNQTQKLTYLWTISNISCHLNTKKSKRKYFHKPKITICFLQSITNILNNSNIESCTPQKITKSVQEWIFFRWNSLCWHESCLWEGSQKSFYSLWM